MSPILEKFECAREAMMAAQESRGEMEWEKRDWNSRELSTGIAQHNSYRFLDAIAASIGAGWRVSKLPSRLTNQGLDYGTLLLIYKIGGPGEPGYLGEPVYLARVVAGRWVKPLQAP